MPNCETQPSIASAPAFATGQETSPAFPREVIEIALAHIVGDKAKQAYRHGDALDKRRKLMDRGGLLRATVSQRYCHWW